MNYFFFPQDWSKLALWALKILVSLSARSSSQIIALSQSSKRHIVKALKIPEDKINVTYMGVNKIFHPHHNRREMLKIKNRMGIKGNFILSVANSHPHKNLRRLLQAYYILRKDKGITHQLLLAGNPGRDHLELVRMVRKLGIGREVIFSGYIPHHQMPLVYQAADLFVFPSLYEGFGLPILESMACGTPVVSSNAASLPEVVGKAGILVDPYDVNGMAEAMYRVLSDNNLAQDLIKKGLRQSKRFSWVQTAKDTLAVYKKAMAD
jgi:glycosyltransferase involved in cell wall biosynthesis